MNAEKKRRAPHEARLFFSAISEKKWLIQIAFLIVRFSLVVFSKDANDFVAQQ